MAVTADMAWYGQNNSHGTNIYMYTQKNLLALLKKCQTTTESKKDK